MVVPTIYLRACLSWDVRESKWSQGPMVKRAFERDGFKAPIRIAVAGAGMITEQAHVPAVVSHPDALLVAIIDPFNPHFPNEALI